MRVARTDRGKVVSLDFTQSERQPYKITVTEVHMGRERTRASYAMTLHSAISVIVNIVGRDDAAYGKAVAAATEVLRARSERIEQEVRAVLQGTPYEQEVTR